MSCLELLPDEFCSRSLLPRVRAHHRMSSLKILLGAGLNINKTDSILTTHVPLRGLAKPP
jgi:hypothetical protein